MAYQSSRILRNFRNMPPTRFHTFNQRVSKCLSENKNILESTWAANPTLLQSYLAMSEKHNGVYHEATYGSKLVISQREILQAQLVTYLDEIALVLEAAALRTPEILLTSGFDLTRDRRSSTRAKATAASEASVSGQSDQQG